MHVYFIKEIQVFVRKHFIVRVICKKDSDFFMAEKKREKRLREGRRETDRQKERKRKQRMKERARNRQSKKEKTSQQ